MPAFGADLFGALQLIRNGQVRNAPIYVPMRVTTNGERVILGTWDGNGGRGRTVPVA